MTRGERFRVLQSRAAGFVSGRLGDLLCIRQVGQSVYPAGWSVCVSGRLGQPSCVSGRLVSLCIRPFGSA